MPEQQGRREGFHDPIYCPRGRADCKSLAQIISTGHVSFVCCGEHDGTLASVPADRYRFCHKTAEGIDVVMNHDQRDMSHIAAVYSWALAAVIAPDAGSAIDGVRVDEIPLTDEQRKALTVTRPVSIPGTEKWHPDGVAMLGKARRGSEAVSGVALDGGKSNENP